ncbi:glycosyltransferase [Nonomuraea roseoviolacea]|uniref:Glycosyltransferase involved in cell wall biosynthesis n=1 Tax=Nonomuraea roseoviolacea subsp. carminata TaxID=160689 RepID=A0ABT1K6B8_9ACTN|nr:glycosyltransferase [Nonomuraea roseoviolacea]MCP2349164.1 glycosyltransferase involved in cell wall biosynthesis [Nonomuraea roseoviolacea subsp. carminata]
MRDMTHVCEVIKVLHVGGAETLLVERLLAAPQKNIRYTVMCLWTTDETVRRLGAAGIDVVQFTSGPRPFRLLSMATAVRRLRPDVVHLHSPLPAALLRVTTRLTRHRPALISTVHNVRYRLPTMLVDRATGWLDAHTVAVSAQVARAVVSRGARRLTTRIHGVSVTEQRRRAEETARIRQEWNVPATAFLIAHVANFRPQKQHDLLLQAAAQVVRRDSRAVFALAGQGPLEQQIARGVAELGSDQVRFLGCVPDAARLIAASDLLVLSSAYEGLPVVVMEALAAGVPVVSTKVGGVPELVEDGKNGYLTGPGDPDALAGAILRAMRPDVHARLCQGARDSADLVDIGRTAEWFEGLYDEVRTS